VKKYVIKINNASVPIDQAISKLFNFQLPLKKTEINDTRKATAISTVIGACDGDEINKNPTFITTQIVAPQKMAVKQMKGNGIFLLKLRPKTNPIR